MSFVITVVDNITNLGITETPVIISDQVAGIQGTKGDTGPAGPANTLSIGTVSSGATPSATITGTSPTQTLNLVLKTGDTGPIGQGYTQKADWNSSTNYAAYDVVYYNGYSYVALQAGSNKNPKTQTAYWTKFSGGFSQPLGDWNAFDTYDIGDIVTSNGSTYYSIQAGTNKAVTNTAYWVVLAAKGTTGDTGTVGPTGPAGPTTATVGNAVLVATYAANVSSTPTPVFRDSSGTVKYFSLDKNTTYLIEGQIQLTTKSSASAAAARLSLLYYSNTTGTTLAAQGALLRMTSLIGVTSYITPGLATDVNTNADTTYTSTTGLNHYITYRAWIKTNLTTDGYFNLGATQSVAGSTGTDLITGSYMNVYKLGSGSTNLAGTWT